ncbi:hypothetical protein D3C85_1465100 [compost metagenome]
MCPGWIKRYPLLRLTKIYLVPGMGTVTALTVITESSDHLYLKPLRTGHDRIQAGIIDAHSKLRIERHLRSLFVPDLLFFVIFHFIIIIANPCPHPVVEQAGLLFIRCGTLDHRCGSLGNIIRHLSVQNLISALHNTIEFLFHTACKYGKLVFDQTS